MAHHEVLPDALAAPKYRTRGTPPPYSLNDRRVSLDTLASSRIQRGPNLVNHSCEGDEVAGHRAQRPCSFVSSARVVRSNCTKTWVTRTSDGYQTRHSDLWSALDANAHLADVDGVCVNVDRLMDNEESSRKVL
jgi:hypothetical protein